MSEMYVSLDEAAVLEGISYKGFTSRISRNEDKFSIITEPNPNGGKDRVLVSVSSLSPQARKKHQLQTAVKQDTTGEPPWYIYTDFNWYKEKYPNYFYEAVEISRYIGQYLNKEIKMKAGAFQKFMAEKYNTSTRTIRRYVDAYQEASVWASNREFETGTNHDYLKIMAVGRKPKEDCNFPSLTEEMKASIENIYYDEIFAINHNPITNLYEDLQEIAETKAWTKLPSYDTILRYIDYIKETDGEGARDLVAKGQRYWKNKHMMKRYRNTGALQVLEVVQGDGHTFDCWVSVKRSNGKLQAIRPLLVSWIDTKSRAIVGWVICEDPDAQIVKQSIINTIYPKKNTELPYGMPKYLSIDNGKEFTAQSLTGVPRNVRVCFDDDINGYFKSVGINDNMRCLPHQPWGKPQIERYHRTLNMGFTKRINSYTGSLTGKYTEDKINKNIGKMLENGELMTIEEFSAKFEQWVCKYHKKEHEGLVDQGEETPTPIEVFNNADRYFKAAPPIDYAISQLMKGETRVVTSMGIQRTVEGKKISYTHPDLMIYKGKRVTFKYFPEDITKVIVYDEAGKRICEAVSYELLHIAPKLSEAALTEHVKDQKRQLRTDRNTVKRRQATYEERQELNYEDAGKKVVSPELSEEQSKVTSIVQSKRYKEDKQADKEAQLTSTTIKEGSQTIQNSYLQRKADEAFALLG